VDEGFTAVKIEAASYADFTQLRRRIELVREQVGSDVEIVVDFAWSVPSADTLLGRIRDLQGLNITWLEDALPFGRVTETTRLRREAAVPIGAGDEVTSPSGLADLLSADAVDVLRADALVVGGIAAARGIAEQAHTLGVRLSLHIHPEVHEHCAMAWPACDHVEMLPQDRPFDRAHDLLAITTLDRVVEGRVSPPTRAGSGVKLDDTAVERFAYRHGQIR
jgi:L-alanine-DL-glutamate epimerase-like enolase superfamily enzyme